MGQFDFSVVYSHQRAARRARRARRRRRYRRLPLAVRNAKKLRILSASVPRCPEGTFYLQRQFFSRLFPNSGSTNITENQHWYWGLDEFHPYGLEETGWSAMLAPKMYSKKLVYISWTIPRVDDLGTAAAPVSQTPAGYRVPVYGVVGTGLGTRAVGMLQDYPDVAVDDGVADDDTYRMFGFHVKGINIMGHLIAIDALTSAGGAGTWNDAANTPVDPQSLCPPLSTSTLLTAPLPYILVILQEDREDPINADNTLRGRISPADVFQYPLYSETGEDPCWNSSFVQPLSFTPSEKPDLGKHGDGYTRVIDYSRSSQLTYPAILTGEAVGATMARGSGFNVKYMQRFEVNAQPNANQQDRRVPVRVDTEKLGIKFEPLRYIRVPSIASGAQTYRQHCVNPIHVWMLVGRTIQQSVGPITPGVVRVVSKLDVSFNWKGRMGFG